jgi:iron complex outermembrane receptor protein
MRPREATMNSDVLDLKTTYEGNGFTLNIQLGKTTSTGGTDFEMVLDDGTGGTPIPGGKYDFTSGVQKWQLNGFDLASYDPGSLAMGTGPNFNKTPKTDDEKYVQFDVEVPLDNMGVINSVKLGYRYADHNTTSRKFDFLQSDSFNPVISTSGLGQGTFDVGYDDLQMKRFDVGALKDWAKSSIIGEKEDLGAYSEIQEDNSAAYIMASYSGENYRGNFGVRYIKTDAESVYFINDQRNSTSASYSEYLPSFNLAYDVEEDIILRFAAARTAARPQYNDMYVNPSPTGTNDDTPNNQHWIIGNVGLKPFISDQYDLGIEWYFDESSILSAGIFYKDVKNFVAIDITENVPATEIPFPIRDDEAVFGWTVEQKTNGKKATIKGLEVQYQQDFANGFGTMINYTYTDTSTSKDTFSDQNPYLSDSSKNTYNLTGFYENDDMSVRLSYNYRSAYMLRESGAYGNRLHKGFGSLDASAVYHYNEHIDFKLDVVNLLGDDSKQEGNNQFQTNRSGFTDGFPLYQYQMATRVNLGVSFKF